jgi:hypothetical protein
VRALALGGRIVPKPPKRPRIAPRIQVEGKSVYIGRWPSQRAADIARDRAALYFGLPLRNPEVARTHAPASPAQLMQEASQREKKRTSSRFLGVSWHASGKYWRVSIQARGAQYEIAGLHDEQQAAVLRDRLMLHLLGSAAVLNFPTRKLKPGSYDQIQTELREARFASHYRGVSPQTVAQRETWSAHIIVKGKQHFLGRYATERKAAIAFDRAGRYYFGRSAKLNFPSASHRLEPAGAAALRAEAHAELKKTKQSRFHGVSRQRAAWKAVVVHRYHVHRLGSFESEELAAEAYDKAAVRLHGNEAKLNFHPVTGEELCGQRVHLVEAKATSLRRT